MVKDRRDALDKSPEELRQEVDQLHTDVNRLSELVHVLMTRQYPELSGQEKFEHFPIYTDGYRHLHPADMIPLKDGSVLLTAREATEHVARDGDIVVLRSENNVRKWTKASRFGVPDLDEREAVAFNCRTARFFWPCFTTRFIARMENTSKSGRARSTSERASNTSVST